jgi:solute carrier family 36 (proton-coupled amino acid transporter)
VIIKKHLVSGTSSPRHSERVTEEFNSLQLQSGDITRPLYRYAERATLPRSKSFSQISTLDDSERETSVQEIMVPGGFRRNFLRRNYWDQQDEAPTFLARNFLHFLTLYGHFAGEDLEDWDEAVTSGM